MKWEKKGYELSQYLKVIPETFHKEVFVFGAGKIGKIMGGVLNEFGILGGFIDNNPTLIGKILNGSKIISLNDYLDNRSNIAIVISTSNNFAIEIEKQLIEHKLEHNKDYYFYEEFNNKILPIVSTYYFSKCYMRLAQITLTERCTLKCKKCAHACYNVKNTSKDMPILEVYRSADAFFSKVDYINEFVLIGGEPLLYKNLLEAIIYIGDRYRKQMLIYSITTNGTLVPPKEILEVCKKYKVLFRISNYSKAIPKIKDSQNRLITKLKEYGVEYTLASPEGTWIDYGFEYFNRGTREEDLIQAFDQCLTPCREVRGNKLFFCVMARSVSDNLNYNEGKDEYLDLDKLTGENYKKELLEFNLGYSEKGYLDMCRRCHGMDAINYPIPVAEQL